jgi:hypothetical protein
MRRVASRLCQVSVLDILDIVVSGVLNYLDLQLELRRNSADQGLHQTTR